MSWFVYGNSMISPAGGGVPLPGETRQDVPERCVLQRNRPARCLRAALRQQTLLPPGSGFSGWRGRRTNVETADAWRGRGRPCGTVTGGGYVETAFITSIPTSAFAACSLVAGGLTFCCSYRFASVNAINKRAFRWLAQAAAAVITLFQQQRQASCGNMAVLLSLPRLRIPYSLRELRMH